MVPPEWDMEKPQLSQVLSELKKDYLKAFPKKIELLKRLTESKNWEALMHEYHKLKGTGKTYGFPDVSVISEKMEGFAKNPDSRKTILFDQAVVLLQRMYEAYSEEKTLNLKTDPIGKSILAIKN